MTRFLQISICLLATFSFAQEPPPRPAPTGKPPERSALQKTGDVTYEIGGVQINSATREVRIPCTVNMTEGIIEYALVTETGKTHESLLKTKVKPFDVQLAMLLCHYEPHPGELVDILSNAQPELLAFLKKKMEKPGANLVKLTAEWKDKDGKNQNAALGDWIHNEREKKALDIPHWVFNGSDIGDGNFSADIEGSVISVHHDLAGIISNPARWADEDGNWELKTKKIPPLDSPVTLVISPVKPDEPRNIK